MEEKIITAIRDHKVWVDTLGKNGKKINLDEEILEGIEWPNIDLSQGSFIDCKFRKNVMKCWDFYAAWLCSACFEEVLMSSVTFVKANLSYAQFSDVRIQYTNFSKSDLENCSFKNVEISDSKFIHTILSGTDFRNAHLKNVDFSGAWIENVIFDEASVLQGINSLTAAHIKSVNIGAEEKPIYLKGEEAFLWLSNRVVR